MALRMSGLASGMDTESIVTELMKAQRLKSTKIENKITTMEWKQEKWKSLNKKLYSFYTGSLSKLRMQGSFSTKAVTSSNESKVSVTGNTSAPEGSHTLKITQLASSQYATSGQLGAGVTSSTKLSDLGFKASEGTTITIASGNKEVTLDIREKTTVGDFVNSLKSAGLNASYDTNQKRFFISSKESGFENSFSITTSSSEEALDRNEIRDYVNFDTLSSTAKDSINAGLASYANPATTAAAKDKIRTNLLTTKHAQVRADYIKNYVADQAKIDEATASERARLEAELPEGQTLDEKVLKAAVDAKLKADATSEATAKFEEWKSGSAPGTNVFEAAETGLDDLLTKYTTDDGTVINQTNSLSFLKLNEIVKNGDGTISESGTADMVLVKPTDAKVIYNNAELTSSSNSITANGLTFTLKGLTATDETLGLSVTNNTKAVYDMVKDFVTTYNELIKEMNELYGAASAKGFDPLTDEEKDAMSETQIDQWENKIKDSLLRRDNNLGSLLNTMRSTLSESVEVGGKRYSLSTLGISSENYTEKGILHISGDADDNLLSGAVNKLMDTLTQDPDTVMKVFNQLSEKLYSSMTKSMSSTSLRSALTLYNDKEMTKTVTNYKEDLKKLEGKLLTMEDRYYKQFSAMETAMAKMNSQSSSLASLLGNNSQR